MSILPMKLHSWGESVVAISPPAAALSAPSSPLISATEFTLHGFACASCTDPGGTTNPATRTVAIAITAAIKIVLFIVK